jgi:NAD(P)-dependent dehydrogenase (short-subunit alcohol dehydrogenase family)
MTAQNKVALVTGANKGIGFEIARGLGSQGITVIVGARDGELGRRAVEQLHKEGIDAHTVTLDVLDESSIAAAADAINREFGKLDILVNNAGISLERGQKPSESSANYLRDTYATNVIGVVSVTNALLPLLRKSPSGRIVNQSSSMGSLGLATAPDSPFVDLNLLAYNSSKAALNSVTIEYAKEFRGTPIKINASDPGYVATDLNKHRGYRTPKQGAVAAVRLATLPDDGPSGTFQNETDSVDW